MQKLEARSVAHFDAYHRLFREQYFTWVNGAYIAAQKHLHVHKGHHHRQLS